jgi:S1-C subfamily serine protease
VSFGAAVRGVTAEIAAEKRLPATYGVEVGSVKEGSPAETAGIRAGDVITGIGAYTLTGGAEQFRRAVSLKRPGDAMNLAVWRDGQSQELVVTFPVSQPEEQPAAG